MSKLFSITNINRYFKITDPLKNTQGVIEAPQSHLQKIAKDNTTTIESLMKKHNTRDKDKAYNLEIDDLKNSFEPSQEALEYLEQLNVKYKDKTIKFYYTDPMLNYFSINDSDCDHIPVYEEVCKSIELIQGENRKLPMIITKEKNYSLIDVVNIEIVENQIPTIKEVLQKAATLDAESYELTTLAEKIVETLEDKKWAINIYKKALKVCKESGDACIVAISIDNTLEDKEFVFEVLLKAYSMKKTNYDFCELLETCRYSELSNNTILNWIEEYAKVCKTSNDFLALSKISESHRSFALNKALENATDVYECFEIIDGIKKK